MKRREFIKICGYGLSVAVCPTVLCASPVTKRPDMFYDRDGVLHIYNTVRLHNPTIFDKKVIVHEGADLILSGNVRLGRVNIIRGDLTIGKPTGVWRLG